MGTWFVIGSAALAGFWLVEVTFMWFTLRAELRASPALAVDEHQLRNRGGPRS